MKLDGQSLIWVKISPVCSASCVSIKIEHEQARVHIPDTVLATDNIIHERTWK